MFGGAKKGRRGRAEKAAAQQSYLRVIVPMLAGCSRAVAAIGTMVQSPRWDDGAWREALGLRLAALRTLHEELAGVRGVPRALRDAHGAILDAGHSVVEGLDRLAGAGDIPGPGDQAALAELIARAAENLSRSAGVVSAELSRLE